MSRLFTLVGCRCAFDGIRAKEAGGELEQSCRRCCLDITASKAKCDIPVTPAAGKSWRITEKAPPPQPSERASFFKGTLEQARLAGLTDEEIVSIAAALKPELKRKKGLVTQAVP